MELPANGTAIEVTVQYGLKWLNSNCRPIIGFVLPRMYWDPKNTFRVKISDEERIAIIGTENIKSLTVIDDVTPLTKDEIQYYCTLYHEERERTPSRYAKWDKKSSLNKTEKSKNIKPIASSSSAVNIPASSAPVYRKVKNFVFRSSRGEFHLKIGPNIIDCDCPDFKEHKMCRHVKAAQIA